VRSDAANDLTHHRGATSYRRELHKWSENVRDWKNENLIIEIPKGTECQIVQVQSIAGYDALFVKVPLARKKDRSDVVQGWVFAANVEVDGKLASRLSNE
jgi:hypothetical protein